MHIKITSDSPEETQSIAASLAAYLRDYKPRKDSKALVISLEGELGSGKTEFMKGIGKALQLNQPIFSPTFLLMKRFPLSKFPFQFLWHLDCYRLKNAQEIKELGFSDMIRDPKNLIFVEWGDKIKTLMPSSCWTIKFEVQGPKTRVLTLEYS